MFRKAGFTLLEILIAIFIFTLVAMIIVSGLHTVLTSQTGTEKKASQFADLQMALTLMSRDLIEVVDRPITTGSGSIESAFSGSPNSMTFTHGGVSNPLNQLARSTLQRTRYRLEKNILLRERWPLLDRAKEIKPEQRALLSHVTEFQFEYLDQKGKTHNRWPPADSSDNSDESIPRAVRISVSFDNLGKLTQLYVIPSQKFPKQN